MTSACGWGAFHIHFSVRISAGERANLVSVEKSRRGRKRKKAVGIMGTWGWHGLAPVVVGKVHWSAHKRFSHAEVRIGAKDMRHLRHCV